MNRNLNQSEVSILSDQDISSGNLDFFVLKVEMKSSENGPVLDSHLKNCTRSRIKIK